MVECSKCNFYVSPRLTGEILDCSMPVTLDTYNKCSYNCLYCFSYYQRSHITSLGADYQKSELQSVNVDTIKKIFSCDRSIRSAGIKKFFPFIMQNQVIQFGGLSDQFDEYERRCGVTLKLLEFFADIRYPICFSTKGAWWVWDERYRRLFKNRENWNTKISIINTDPELAKKIELGCPSPDDRLAAMAELAKLNPDGGVTLRLRPFIIGMSNLRNEHVELIRRASEAGATAVSTEFFCLEARANDPLMNRYNKMSEALGFDIYDFYRRHSHGAGYRRLNRAIKNKYFVEMEDACKKYGLRFYVSDAHHKERCANGSCCGLGPKWNYSRGQFTEALMIAKERGEVRFSDIAPYLAVYKTMQLANAGIKLASNLERVKLLQFSVYDYFRYQWNTPRNARSPAVYFGGALQPAGLDENNDVIYKYKAIE